MLNSCTKLVKKLHKFHELDTLPADLSFRLIFSNNAKGEESTRIMSYHRSRDHINPSAKRKPGHSNSTARRRDYSCSEIVLTLLTNTHHFTSVLTSCFLKSIHFASTQPLQLQYKFNLLTKFMSFSPDLRGLRNGETYSKTSDLEMSVIPENTTNTCASGDPKRFEEPTHGISHELKGEKIKANWGPLSEQITTLTQLLEYLIQQSSARNFPTEDARTQPTQARHSFSHEAGTSRALLAKDIGSTGFPPSICSWLEVAVMYNVIHVQIFLIARNWSSSYWSSADWLIQSKFCRVCANTHGSKCGQNEETWIYQRFISLWILASYISQVHRKKSIWKTKVLRICFCLFVLLK